MRVRGVLFGRVQGLAKLRAPATNGPPQEHSIPSSHCSLCALDSFTVDMAKDDKRVAEVDGVPAERKAARPDFTVPPPRKQLPKELQDTLDNEEKLWEVLYDGTYVHPCSS